MNESKKREIEKHWMDRAIAAEREVAELRGVLRTVLPYAESRAEDIADSNPTPGSLDAGYLAKAVSAVDAARAALTPPKPEGT